MTMTDQERITKLEERLAAAEARIAQLERQGYSHPVTPQPYVPYPMPSWPLPQIWCDTDSVSTNGKIIC